MAGRGALCRGQKLGEHRAGAGVDAPPDGDQYFLPVELADTVQGVSSEQRLHGCPGRVASSAHLFLSTKRPHHPVTSATIARWIKQGMSKAGVDTSLFGAHFTRAASTSAAKRKGMPQVPNQGDAA